MGPHTSHATHQIQIRLFQMYNEISQSMKPLRRESIQNVKSPIDYTVPKKLGDGTPAGQPLTQVLTFEGNIQASAVISEFDEILSHSFAN